MRYTKNVILALIGIFITIYVVSIGLNIYIIQTHKNALEEQVPRVVKQTLEEAYITKDEAVAIGKLKEELIAGKEQMRSLEVKKLDLEKGILSIVVTEHFGLVTGEEREISVEKTVIMEREEMVPSMVKVTFLLDGEIYKEYLLEKGEECPLPKSPSGLFGGWIEYGDANYTTITHIGKVWEDKVYLAITK